MVSPRIVRQRIRKFKRFLRGFGFRVLESGSWAKVLRFDGLLKTDVFTLLPSHKTWFMAGSFDMVCFKIWS